MSGADAYKLLVGQEVVADRLGVTSQAVSNWYRRAATAPPESHLRKMPEPTPVQYKPGKPPGKVWRQAQLSMWEKWYARHLAEQERHTPGRNRKVS